MMGFASDIERRLFAYLSPRKRAEVIAAVDAEDQDDAQHLSTSGMEIVRKDNDISIKNQGGENGKLA